MRIAKVIGTITLSRSHPSMAGLPLRLAIPMSLEELAEDREPAGECLALVDLLGTGLGDRIALSESAEAAAPFKPEMKPIDAYNAAILDNLDVNN